MSGIGSGVHVQSLLLVQRLGREVNGQLKRDRAHLPYAE